MSSPIQYTSRTFLTILADINADPDLVDKPEWFKRMLAGVGDMVSMINNAAANNAFLRTAFTRQAVLDLCAQIGYEVPPATTSTGTVLFHFSRGATMTLSAAEAVALTRGTIAVASKRFESRVALAPAAETDVINLGTTPISGNAITTARSYITGERVTPSCSGTMPTGLSASSDYYAITISTTSIKLASSAANAIAGTNLTISGGSGNLTLAIRSIRATCYQQEDKGAVTVGTSDGVTGWQEFDLPDANALRDSIVVTVNSEAWTLADTLALSAATDKHYQHVYKSDGTSYIRFGDGSYGAIPGNFDVVVNYAVGGGSESNVTTIGSISVYGGTNAGVSGCINATAMTGGGDAQSSEVAKRVAPGTLKSRDRFVTAADGEYLAVNYGGLSQAKVIANAYGVLSAEVVGVALGGGNPTAPLKAAIQAYLIAKTLLASIDVRVVDATITAHVVTSAAKVLPGYAWATVLPMFRLAWKLYLSEAGQEIIDSYLSDGVVGAVTLINSIFTETYSSTSYTAIQQLLDALDAEGARTFGDSIYESDVVSFIQANVDGIDYMTIAVPASFPLVHVDDEISSYGALTLTEIA